MKFIKLTNALPVTSEQIKAAERSVAAQKMWDVLEELSPPEEIKDAFISVCDFLQVPYVFESELEEEDDFEPDDSQLEMGFNPYMGGYDFDC